MNSDGPSVPHPWPTTGETAWGNALELTEAPDTDFLHELRSILEGPARHVVPEAGGEQEFRNSDWGAAQTGMESRDPGGPSIGDAPPHTLAETGMVESDVGTPSSLKGSNVWETGPGTPGVPVDPSSNPVAEFRMRPGTDTGGAWTSGTALGQPPADIPGHSGQSLCVEAGPVPPSPMMATPPLTVGTTHFGTPFPTMGMAASGALVAPSDQTRSQQSGAQFPSSMHGRVGGAVPLVTLSDSDSENGNEAKAGDRKRKVEECVDSPQRGPLRAGPGLFDRDPKALTALGGRALGTEGSFRERVGSGRSALSEQMEKLEGQDQGMYRPAVHPPAMTAMTTAVGGSGDVDPQTTAAVRGVMEGLSIIGAGEEADVPEGLLNVPLLKHQRLALAWMEARERSHPAGGMLADDQGLGKTVSTIALILKVQPPKRGGWGQVPPSTVHVLEEEGGVKPKAEQAVHRPWPQGAGPGGGRLPAGTLVVCPTSVLRQWATELAEKVEARAGVSILIYHGASRTKSAAELARYSVVVTTFAIVGMEVPKAEDGGEKRNPSDYGLDPQPRPPTKKKASPVAAGPLGRLAWFRVVLDEAQSIKNRSTQVARACWGLRAKRRWCLSGTPIQNSIEDLFSYFRFLRYSPYDDFPAFRSLIKDPIARNPKVGFERLRIILATIMIRRTKGSKIGGQPIVALPDRLVALEKTEFSAGERAFYESLEAASRDQFNEYAAAGSVQSNYVSILMMLLRLRQACNHPSLVKKHRWGGGSAGSEKAAREMPPQRRLELLELVEGGGGLCPFCEDVVEEAVVAPCGHVFCRACALEQCAVGEAGITPCPRCKHSLHPDHLFESQRLKGAGEGAGAGAGEGAERRVRGEEEFTTSSKIQALIRRLADRPTMWVEVEQGKVVQGAGGQGVEGDGAGGAVKEGRQMVQTVEKAIVFSQWTSMLTLVEAPLQAAGVKYRRLDGTMSVAARERATSDFKTKAEVTVILMSLKAASLGLNMVAACHVLLLDVWWNPATEEQAIDRAHRIGQTRTVRVARFTVRNTVEDRILALQEKKRSLAASAYGEAEGGVQRTRLTAEDLHFLFRSERRPTPQASSVPPPPLRSGGGLRIVPLE